MPALSSTSSTKRLDGGGCWNLPNSTKTSPVTLDCFTKENVALEVAEQGSPSHRSSTPEGRLEAYGVRVTDADLIAHQSINPSLPGFCFRLRRDLRTGVTRQLAKKKALSARGVRPSVSSNASTIVVSPSTDSRCKKQVLLGAFRLKNSVHFGRKADLTCHGNLARHQSCSA